MPEFHVTQFHQTYHNCKHHQSLSLITYNPCWDTSFSFGGAVSALDHILQPSQSQWPFTPSTVGSLQASRRRILCIWAASCGVWGLMNSSCWYWPLSEHHLLASQSLIPVLHERHSHPLIFWRRSQEDNELVSNCSLSFSWYMEWLQIEISFMYYDIKSYCFSVAEPNAVLILRGKGESFWKRLKSCADFTQVTSFLNPPM